MMDEIKEDKKHASSVIISEELEKEALLTVQKAIEEEEFEDDKLNFKYKGNRIRCERRDIVEKASDRLRTISRLANFPILFLENSEADDVLATLANIALGFDSTSSVTVVSPDKDFFQLLESPRVRLLRDFRYQTMSSEGFDFLKFKNDFDGIEPDMFVDYLALLGDTADNVPGVRGCGKVKALELLTTYGNLEEIFIAAQEKKIRGKLGEELAKSEHVAFLSKALLQLDCNLELKLPSGFKTWDEALKMN
jgi:5'-3' exonuclease